MRVPHAPLMVHFQNYPRLSWRDDIVHLPSSVGIATVKFKVGGTWLVVP